MRNMSFATEFGRTYMAKASTNLSTKLVDSEPVFTTSGTGAPVPFTDHGGWRFNRRFYRVVTP